MFANSREFVSCRGRGIGAIGKTKPIRDDRLVSDDLSAGGSGMVRRWSLLQAVVAELTGTESFRSPELRPLRIDDVSANARRRSTF